MHSGNNPGGLTGGSELPPRSPEPSRIQKETEGQRSAGTSFNQRVVGSIPALVRVFWARLPPDAPCSRVSCMNVTCKVSWSTQKALYKWNGLLLLLLLLKAGGRSSRCVSWGGKNMAPLARLSALRFLCPEVRESAGIWSHKVSGVGSGRVCVCVWGGGGWRQAGKKETNMSGALHAALRSCETRSPIDGGGTEIPQTPPPPRPLEWDVVMPTVWTAQTHTAPSEL